VESLTSSHFKTSVFNGDEKTIRDFVKKMLGRLVFLQFLQKKGWLDVAIDKHYGQGNKNFVAEFFANNNNDAFYTTCLVPLFFETLNNPKNEVFKVTNSKFPYLNGGLFERDEIEKKPKADFIVFSKLLFENLFSFFGEYNFTIDESTPDDLDIGIDPEMLGHIFENLLEDNREKGAFYTPKLIVQYMCQEVLIQYLELHLGKDAAIEKFIRYKDRGADSDKHNFIHKNASKISDLLDDVKICDPAIGSGAFPMGLLQEIFHAKLALDWTLMDKKGDVKRAIIQNSIYGVDKDKGAVDIARLRFWLSLIVDEDAEAGEKPQPLPNFDYKIMQGDSLLESFEGVDLSNLADMDKEDTFLSANKHQLELGADFSLKKQSMLVFDQKSKTQLYQLIHDYYNYDETANTKYKSKQFIKDEINKIVEGKLIAKFYLQKPDLEQKIKDIRTAIKANRLMAADAPGVRLRKEKNLDKLNKELADKETELGKLNSIIEHLHELQTRTDKPYFLWHLWFKEVFDKGGFDIVIGNPPYIQLQKMGKDADILKKANFQTFERTGDIYTLFFEQGFKYLRPKGSLVYITGSAWLRSNYGKSLRRFFLENTNGKILIDLSDAEVFESATVLTTIHLFTKEKNEKQLKALRLTKENQSIIKNLPANFDKLHTVIKNLDENAWVIANTNKQGIKTKVTEQGKKLKDWNIEINYGIKTGLNDAFVIDDEKRKELIKQDAKSAEIIKPLLRGRDLGRYNFKCPNLYIIGTFPTLGIDIKKYPAIEKHLKSFGKEKLVQTGEAGSRKKTGNKWFETQDQINYWHNFEKPKILYPNMVKDISFTYDDEGYYVNDKCFILTGENLKYLLAVFNSKLFRYCYEDDFPELQGNSREIKAFVMKELFVKYPNDKEQEPFEALTNKILQLKKEKLPTVNYENKIDALVFHLYGLTESEMLQVLDAFKDMSIQDRNQIQNEYWNIANNEFKPEV
jgi:hypothetical protein